MWLSGAPQCHFLEDSCLLRYVAAVQLFRSTKTDPFRGWRVVLWRGVGVSVVDVGVVGVGVACGGVEDESIEKQGVLPVRSVDGC